MENAALAVATKLAPPPNFLDLQAERDKLAVENEELRARLDLLQREFGLSGLVFPSAWRLTNQESRLLALLIRREMLSKEQALVGLYSECREDWPDIKIVDVLICKIRAKLKRAEASFEIETVWGRGHRIAEPHRTILVERFKPAECAPIRGFNS